MNDSRDIWVADRVKQKRQNQFDSLAMHPRYDNGIISDFRFPRIAAAVLVHSQSVPPVKLTVIYMQISEGGSLCATFSNVFSVYLY
jgi:hypothetical protein